MLPQFDEIGNLPPGIHWATWDELLARFGSSSRRRKLLSGLHEAMKLLQYAECKTVYVNGSFVTTKEVPGDFDACWDIESVNPDKLDPVFFDFSDRRAAQKKRFGGELFPAQMKEGAAGNTFLEFFQIDRSIGQPKGIIAIRLEEIPHD